jgi:alcohol dehydrogenase (cytochrome c)
MHGISRMTGGRARPGPAGRRRWVVLAAAAALGASACTSGGAAPAVTAAAPLGWPVFGGVTDNTRFSPATQINGTSVAHLGLAWSTPLGAYQTLSESFPLVTGRTVYITSNTDEVMAFDAVTGQRKWQYAPQVDFTLSRGVGGYGVTVNRGVAVSNGRVYLLTFDDHLQALSQATGEKLWSSPVDDPHSGAYETMAPTTWHGLVFVGNSGSEDGVRGFVAAYDARTGKQVWRFWTVPAPGHGWVPKGPHGGGTVYMPPTIDARTGLLYVGTGNPSPTIVGVGRPGPDLYTDSILALNARTGKLVWHHQQVAHDLWDYDAASPVMIFNARVHGTTVPAVGEAGKSGYYFILDARTGKDLFPPVAFVKESHSVPTRKGVLECPGSLGGSQYGPAAFSPRTRAAYVTGLNMCMILKVGPRGGAGYKDFGGQSSIPENERQTGTMSAISVDTGKFRWHRAMPWPMIGGATTTAGGLVFAGDAHGTLYAFDAATGAVTWHAYLGLAFGAAPVVYTVGSTEYLAMVVGGSPLSANFGWGNVGARLVVLKLGGAPVKPFPPTGGVAGGH